MTFYDICVVYRVTLKLMTALQLSATGRTFSVWRLFKISLDEINLISFWRGLLKDFRSVKRRILNTLCYTVSNNNFYEMESKKLQKVWSGYQIFMPSFRTGTFQITVPLMAVHLLCPVRNIMKILPRLTSGFFVCLFLPAYTRFIALHSQIMYLKLPYIYTQLHCFCCNTLLYSTVLYYTILY